MFFFRSSTYHRQLIGMNMKLGLKLISAFYLMNGFLMILAPEFWYKITPGVEHTGAMNGHFIRDIGLGFCAASAWAWLPKARHFTPIIFIGGHAALHMIEILDGHFGLNEILRDGVLIIIPAVIFCTLIITQERK